MKHISEFTNVSCLESARNEKKESVALDPLCAQLVDHIFLKFALLCREYDDLYADKRRENAEKLQWTLAFTKNNIKTKAQIKCALDKTETHKWGKPPQLGQFLEWCLNLEPESIEMPPTWIAYGFSIKMNAQFSSWKHPDPRIDLIVRHVINQIGSLEYRAMKEEKAKKVFELYYKKAIKDFIGGGLKDIPKHIEDNSDETVELKKRDEVLLAPYKGMKKEEALKAMKNILNGSHTQ